MVNSFNTIQMFSRSKNVSFWTTRRYSVLITHPTLNFCFQCVSQEKIGIRLCCVACLLFKPVQPCTACFRFDLIQLIPSWPVGCIDKKITQSLFDLRFIKVVYVFNAQFYFTWSMTYITNIDLGFHVVSKHISYG